MLADDDVVRFDDDVVDDVDVLFKSLSKLYNNRVLILIFLLYLKGLLFEQTS